MYIIFGGIDAFDDQPMFWNNKNRWGSLNSAESFSKREKDFITHLPLYNTMYKPVFVKLPTR